MNHTRMEIQTLSGARFGREGLPALDAELLRLVDRALHAESSSEVAAWIQREGLTVLPPLARLRALGLLPAVARALLVPQQLAAARAVAVGASTDHGWVSMANVIWAKAALHVQFPGDIIEAALRFGASSAEATGGDTSTFVQEMLVAAGLAQLREGSLDKAIELLGYLATEHADSPARWMILASRIADGGAASRSPFLRGLLQECTQVALSHDDLVDLVESAYRHGFGNPFGDLDSVRLAERDPFGLHMLHRTPLMQRAADRAYRVTRLTAALGAAPREKPSTQDRVESAYIDAVHSTAGLDGLLWSGGRPPPRQLAGVCDDIVAFLDVVGSDPRAGGAKSALGAASTPGATRAAAGVELIDRVLAVARRIDDPVASVSTAADRLAAWARARDRSQPMAVETVLALLPSRTDVAGPTAECLEELIEDMSRDGETAASMDLRDAARGSDECWQFLRALGRTR